MHETDTASTLEELDAFEKKHRGWFFRGEQDPEWTLKTTLERASERLGLPAAVYEKKIEEAFRRSAHSYLHRVPNEHDQLEWLALMQHYGAPTRLLDFTRSFWIALFFAFEMAITDCVVWALDPVSLGPKDNRDFNVVLRGNIRDGTETDNKLYENAPFYTNERLAIQQGTFLFSLNMRKTFESLFATNRKVHRKLLVKACLFPDLRRRLNDYNCNRRVLFPGIDGYARSFHNHI
jgi:FRG domain-containing protein